MAIPVVATIGQGVDVRESSIPGGGNGLWTQRPFCKNDLITEYCGPIIDHERALKLRKRGKHTHIRVLNSQWLYIDGLKAPMPGAGGASFANDARDPGINNAIFIQKFDRKLGRDRVFLKATRDLGRDEEVFVSYGNTYWQNSRCEAQAVASQHQEQEQLQEEEEDEQQQPEQQRQQRTCTIRQKRPEQQPQQQLQQQQQQIQRQARKSEPAGSKPSRRRSTTPLQDSQQSSDTVQQLGAAGNLAPKRTLPCKRVVMQEAQNAEAELQLLASAQKRVKQQQQQHLAIVNGIDQAGNQECSSSQVSRRQSQRLRSRLQQKLDQQGPGHSWAVQKQRSNSYVLDKQKQKGKRSMIASPAGADVQLPASSKRCSAAAFAGFVLNKAVEAVEGVLRFRRASLGSPP